MAISSLQSLIAKYGANFGIDGKAAVDPKSAQGGANAPESGSQATPSETAPVPVKADTVQLSPDALEYQKAHTSPMGKFQPPNLFGDMLDAFDNAEGSGTSDTPTLADLLGGNQVDYSNPTAAGDPQSYFSSLSQFLE
jgi:hypothetical protein